MDDQGSGTGLRIFQTLVVATVYIPQQTHKEQGRGPSLQSSGEGADPRGPISAQGPAVESNKGKL